MSEFSELCSLLQGTGYGNQMRPAVTLGVGTDALDSNCSRTERRRTAILTYALAGAE